MAQTAISIRLDSDIKPQFDAICKEIGLSANAAFNIFARTLVREKSFPFPVSAVKSDSRSSRARFALEQLQNISADSDKQWSDEEIDDLIARYRRSRE